MARITVEDCLEKENNRFALVQLAAKRTKQLLTGSKLLIDSSKGNKSVVNSLREIAEGVVRLKTEEDIQKEREIAMQKREAELALAAEREAARENTTTIPVASDDSESDSDTEGSEGTESSGGESVEASSEPLSASANGGADGNEEVSEQDASEGTSTAASS